MTNVGETSVPPTTGPLSTHLAHTTLVLEHLVAHGPSTRSELATATGLGRGAIAGLTARLIDAGVLRPAQLDAVGDGRATPLSLSAADRVLVTSMIGVDEAIATLAGLSGEELGRFTVPLAPVGDEQSATPAVALDALAAALSRALARAERSGHPVAEVTVLVDGMVAGSPAVVITDARFGVEPVDVLGELRARLPALAEIEPRLLLPLALEPAAVAAAAAELGELTGVTDILYLAGDTAVAAAAVSGGSPLPGAHGLAMSFAHLPVVEGGVRCECGQRGCLATVASPELVLERADLIDFAATHGRAAALEELVARVEAAEDRARWSWLDAARWVGRALQLVVPTIDPAMVVVGGYWARLLSDVDTAYRANRPTLGGEALAAIPTIAATRVGADAALVGARRQARERLLADPLLLAG
ncbi:ROK family transcriptional regulator [Agromyces sp. NPDC049794]|uniref:ROK family transcriptional regulator n=1 Tax=unclassified Agromyces TaxID=2639701 RepID=UPI0033CF45C4